MSSIARLHDIGHDEIIRANPHIPTSFILPDAPREDIGYLFDTENSLKDILSKADITLTDSQNLHTGYPQSVKRGT